MFLLQLLHLQVQLVETGHSDAVYPVLAVAGRLRSELVLSLVFSTIHDGKAVLKRISGIVL